MMGFLFCCQISKKLQFIFFGFFLFSAPVFSQSAAYEALLDGLYDEKFPTVKPEQITDLAHYQVLDTREEVEFVVSHLPGAIQAGYDSFDLGLIDRLDKAKPVLVYCTVGVRSQDIGRKLQAEGFIRVYNLYGGIIQWANSGRTLEAEGKLTTKVHTYSRTWGIWLQRGEKVY